MKTQLFAPDIDAFTKNTQSNIQYLNSEIYKTYKEIYQIFSCVFAEGTDDVCQIWLEVERGPIEAFGDFEDFKESGEVETIEEFVQLWKDYFPNKTKWYKFQTAKFKDDMNFYLEGKLICTINTAEEPADNISYNLEQFELLAHWLLEKITIETTKLKQDTFSFNSYIQQNLPWSKRFGRILRNDFWDIWGDETLRPDKNLGSEMIEKLKKAVGDSVKGEPEFLDEMTAGKFFRFCEICYDANNYFKSQNKVLLPLEKYLSMADGRDAGLREIDPDSPKAFRDWYHSRAPMGAHPWEICRGGNSTHISLFISDRKGKWDVRLAGSSIGRVEETVRMAVALYENNVPFQLWEAEEIVRMVTGTDFIGIVPDTVFPRYCHGLFPKEDRIIDFMNLGTDSELISKIVEKTFWYPLEEIKLA